MTFYFTPAKEEGGYASVSTSKWKEANSKVTFQEFNVTETDSAFFLSGWATAFTDIKNFRDQNWQFQPCLVALKIAKKDYSRTFNGETKHFQQSGIEKVICEELTKWDKALAYAGTLALMHMDTYEPEEWANVDDVMKQALMSSMLKVKPIVGELQYIGSKKFEAPTIDNKDERGSGRASVSEYDKLKSREKYLLEIFREQYPDEKIEKLCDLVVITEKPGFFDLMSMYDCLLNGAKVAK